MVLPGKRAKRYRVAAVEALRNYINPTEELVQDVIERYRQQEISRTRSANVLVNNQNQLTTM